MRRVIRAEVISKINVSSSVSVNNFKDDPGVLAAADALASRLNSRVAAAEGRAAKDGAGTAAPAGPTPDRRSGRQAPGATDAQREVYAPAESGSKRIMTSRVGNCAAFAVLSAIFITAPLSAIAQNVPAREGAEQASRYTIW